MNKRISKSGVVASIVTLTVLLIIFNICTFAIPFNKNDLIIHYTVYGCSQFLIISQILLIISQLFLEEKPNQKIIGLPILYFGYVTLVIQLVCTVIFYLINCYFVIPLWIVILIECLVIGFGVIQISLGFFFKHRNIEYHENFANTKFMDEFRSKIKILCKINKNTNIEKNLEDLLDIALGSDPVSSEATLDSEDEILSLLKELDKSIKNGIEEESRSLINETKNALIERNVICKASK